MVVGGCWLGWDGMAYSLLHKDGGWDGLGCGMLEMQWVMVHGGGLVVGFGWTGVCNCWLVMAGGDLL